MDMHLVVVKPFDDFARGDVISDALQITTILKGEHAHSVVRVAQQIAKGS